VSVQVKRLEEQNREVLREKDEVIENLQSEMRSLRQAYKLLLHQKGVSNFSDPVQFESMQDELNRVKQEYSLPFKSGVLALLYTIYY